MSDRDALRFAARRAAMSAAFREGDAERAARAAARLRVIGMPVTTQDFARARSARRALGRAIVNARLPQAVPAPKREEAAIFAETPSRAAWYALAGVGALVVALLLFGNGVGLDPTGGGGTPEAASAAEPQRVTLLTVSRGRTITLPDQVAVVQETATPAPTAEPSAEPTAAPRATAGSGSGSRTGSPAPGGGGGGDSGGGIGILPRTPTPRPTATPPAPPAGFGRFNIVVYDASTGRPLPGTCVIVGTIVCGTPGSLTDAAGRWSADLPATATTTWDATFVLTGYITQHRTLNVAAGRTVTYQVFLRRLF